MKKKILIVIGILLIIYISFVTFDCIRLRNSKTGTKPLITISMGEYENGTIYKSLGYSIKYYVDIGEKTEINGTTYIEELGYGAEFRLFDKILIWAWIE